ncbi:MAG: ArsA family ATPase [Actinomycetota bacterium]
MTELSALLHERHIIVCCGPGGVGKTTTAAALALRAADEGRTVIVCTIDPAKRLAASLGLAELDNKPRLVPQESFGDKAPQGELWAMMLDTKTTFDEMVENMTPREQAERILSNPFYKHVSSTLSGTQEYMAMEKLYELHEEGRWHLIVIDTPPTRSALDFLDAPKKITDFLDSRFLRTLLWPTLAAGRSTFKVMNFGARAMLKMATRITGSELLLDVASFFQAFDGMFGHFKARAERVRELLSARRTAFVIVSAPQEASLNEAAFFIERLQKEKMPLGAAIVNRTHDIPLMIDDVADRAAEAAKHDESSVLTTALKLYATWSELADREREAIAKTLPGDGPRVWMVPDLAEEISTIEPLRSIGVQLFGPLMFPRNRRTSDPKNP